MNISESDFKQKGPTVAMGSSSLRQEEHDRIDEQVAAFLAGGGEIQHLEIVKHTIESLKDKTTPVSQRNKPRNKQ